MSALSASEQLNASVNAAPRKRGRGRPFPKGVSGNPHGRPSREARTAAQLARQAELRAAIASEFDNPTTLENVYIGQAADALEHAERASDKTRNVLVKLALQLTQRIRDDRKLRAAAKPATTAFDRYVAEKAARR